MASLNLVEVWLVHMSHNDTESFIQLASFHVNLRSTSETATEHQRPCSDAVKTNQNYNHWLQTRNYLLKVIETRIEGAAQMVMY